jgi:hypothetical protein
MQDNAIHGHRYKNYDKNMGVQSSLVTPLQTAIHSDTTHTTSTTIEFTSSTANHSIHLEPPIVDNYHCIEIFHS